MGASGEQPGLLNRSSVNFREPANVGYRHVRTSTHLEQALTDISAVEKGVFYTLSLTKDQPAYFVFVGLALACLAWRLILHAFPHFVEISYFPVKK